MSFCFFLYLWNHFVCELSLLPLITVPSPGLYHFFSKCEILPWNLSSRNSPWVWPGGLCNFCGLLQCKQEREPEPQFLQCAACVQEADLLGSISGMFIALCSRQRARGHSLCWPRARSHQRSSGLWWPIILLEVSWSSPAEVLRHCLRNRGRFLLSPERQCELLQCSHPPTPSSKMNELQVTNQIYSLVFSSSPLSSANGRVICSSVETIGESTSAQGIFIHLHLLHFLTSSTALCYFGFGTFWG